MKQRIKRLKELFASCIEVLEAFEDAGKGEMNDLYIKHEPDYRED